MFGMCGCCILLLQMWLFNVSHLSKQPKNGELHTEQLEILEITINIVKIGASLSAIKGEVNDHILGRRGLNREAGSRCNITSTKGSKE